MRTRCKFQNGETGRQDAKNQSNHRTLACFRADITPLSKPENCGADKNSKREYHDDLLLRTQVIASDRNALDLHHLCKINLVVLFNHDVSRLAKSNSASRVLPECITIVAVSPSGLPISTVLLTEHVDERTPSRQRSSLVIVYLLLGIYIRCNPIPMKYSGNAIKQMAPK